MAPHHLNPIWNKNHFSGAGRGRRRPRRGGQREIKSFCQLKFQAFYAEALPAAAPGNFIRTHRTISPLSPAKRVLPAGRRRGALPAPAQQDGGLWVSSSASARDHATLPAPTPAPLPSLARGCVGCPSAAPSYGDRDPLETRSRRSQTGAAASPLTTFLFCLSALMLLTPGPAHG